MPTTYHEPKGLYILEAWANGVPVVQPRHGSFPELIEATGGGLLVDADDPAALAEGLRRMLVDQRTARPRGPCRRASRPRTFQFNRHGPRSGRNPRTESLTGKNLHMKPFTTTRRVEFGDTDMAGIMHFANFFRFMEVAETDFLAVTGAVGVSWRGERRSGGSRACRHHATTRSRPGSWTC